MFCKIKKGYKKVLFKINEVPFLFIHILFD